MFASVMTTKGRTGKEEARRVINQMLMANQSTLALQDARAGFRGTTSSAGPSGRRVPIVLVVGFAVVLALAAVLWSGASSASHDESRTNAAGLASRPRPQVMPGPNPQQESPSMPAGPMGWHP